MSSLQEDGRAPEKGRALHTPGTNPLCTTRYTLNYKEECREITVLWNVGLQVA